MKSSFEIRFLKAFGNLFHLSNTCMANTRDWKTKFSIKYYLITFSLNHTLFSAFSARPDPAFPAVFSTQYPRNGNGWAWGRGCSLHLLKNSFKIVFAKSLIPFFPRQGIFLHYTVLQVRVL